MALEQQLADLEKLAQRARQILEDPRRKKWHDDNRQQLAQIEAEINRLKSRAAPKPMAVSPY